MKWERKKTSLLSHVFPISWLSKLKQMSNKSQLSQPAKAKRKSKPKTPVNSSSLPVCFKPSRLSESGRHLCPISFSPQILDPRTGRDVAGFVEPEDDFWRFSFRKESFEWKKGNEIQVEGKERRALSADFDVSLKIQTSKGGHEKYQEGGSRWVGRGISVAEEEKQQPGRKFSDYSSSPKNSNDPQIGSSGSRNSTHTSHEEIPKFPPLNLRNSHRCRRSGDPPPKGQPNRGKIKQRPRTPKTELFSPRIICKIRALEELKKKKKEGEERGREFESFAVVKSSLDPQKDFRESMVEMISENKIGGAEELENLLACYLSLNSSQYHDVIVKVFRQVWFDLNRECFVSELERGYYDY